MHGPSGSAQKANWFASQQTPFLYVASMAHVEFVLPPQQMNPFTPWQHS